MSFANAINSIFSNQDAFGNLSTSENTARVQLQFPYTINTDQVTTTVTGGRLVGVFYLNGNTQTVIDLTLISTILNNLDTLTISATSSGAAIVASAGITWSEQF